MPLHVKLLRPSVFFVNMFAKEKDSLMELLRSKMNYKNCSKPHLITLITNPLSCQSAPFELCKMPYFALHIRKSFYNQYFLSVCSYLKNGNDVPPAAECFVRTDWYQYR